MARKGKQGTGRGKHRWPFTEPRGPFALAQLLLGLEIVETLEWAVGARWKVHTPFARFGASSMSLSGENLSSVTSNRVKIHGERDQHRYIDERLVTTITLPSYFSTNSHCVVSFICSLPFSFKLSCSVSAAMVSHSSLLLSFNSIHEICLYCPLLLRFHSPSVGIQHFIPSLWILVVVVVVVVAAVRSALVHRCLIPTCLSPFFPFVLCFPVYITFCPPSKVTLDFRFNSPLSRPSIPVCLLLSLLTLRYILPAFFNPFLASLAIIVSTSHSCRANVPVHFQPRC